MNKDLKSLIILALSLILGCVGLMKLATYFISGEYEVCEFEYKGDDYYVYYDDDSRWRGLYSYGANVFTLRSGFFRFHEETIEINREIEDCTSIAILHFKSLIDSKEERDAARELRIKNRKIEKQELIDNLKCN